MRSLMDKSSQRIIALIELLVSQENWITINNLAEAVGASGRTVSDDIAKLKDRWNDLFNVEVSVKKGVKMHNRSSSAVGAAFRDIFEESTALRWLRWLLLHPHNRIEFYEDALFSSRSTLERMIPKINLCLNQRGINIIHKNGQCQIVAQDEQYLRQFYAAFMLEITGIELVDDIVGVSVERIWKVVSNLLVKAAPPEGKALVANDDITTVYHVALCVVSLIRESQGYTIDCEYDVEGEFEPEDVSYILSCFPGTDVSNLRPINAFIHRSFNGWSSPEEKALLNEHAEVFFAELFSSTDIKLDDEAMARLVFIMGAMYLTQKHRIFQTSLLFDRIEYFSNSLKNNSRYMYCKAAKGLERVSQNIGFDITPRLHDLLFWICLEYPEFPNFAQPKTALLISDFGAAHASFLASHISCTLNSMGSAMIEIDTASYSDAPDSCRHKNYDIILTTIPNPPIAHDNVMMIGCYPSRDNLLEVYKRCMAEDMA